MYAADAHFFKREDVCVPTRWASDALRALAVSAELARHALEHARLGLVREMPRVILLGAVVEFVLCLVDAGGHLTLLTSVLEQRPGDLSDRVRRLVRATGAVGAVLMTEFSSSLADDGSHAAAMYVCFPTDSVCYSIFYILEETGRLVEFPPELETYDTCDVVEVLSQDLAHAGA